MHRQGSPTPVRPAEIVDVDGRRRPVLPWAFVRRHTAPRTGQRKNMRTPITDSMNRPAQAAAFPRRPVFAPVVVSWSPASG